MPDAEVNHRDRKKNAAEWDEFLQKPDIGFFMLLSGGKRSGNRKSAARQRKFLERTHPASDMFTVGVLKNLIGNIDK